LSPFFFFSGPLSSCLSLFGLSVSHTRSTVGTRTAAKRSTLSKNYYCRGRFDADRRRGTHAHWWLCSGPTIKIYRYARLSHSPPYLGVGDGVRAAHIYIFFLLYLFISLVYVYYALYNNILYYDLIFVSVSNAIILDNSFKKKKSVFYKHLTHTALYYGLNTWVVYYFYYV